MIVEMRTYTALPGRVSEIITLYDREGRAIQHGHLERMVGYYYTEVGALNQIVHLWAYDSLDDRAIKRARMQKDDEWQKFVGKLMPLLVAMENKILLPAPFFKPTWVEA